MREFAILIALGAATAVAEKLNAISLTKADRGIEATMRQAR